MLTPQKIMSLTCFLEDIWRVVPIFWLNRLQIFPNFQYLWINSKLLSNSEKLNKLFKKGRKTNVSNYQPISFTMWKVSVFEVFLVRIFPHLDWIFPYLVWMRENTVQDAPNTGTYHAGVCLTILGGWRLKV